MADRSPNFPQIGLSEAIDSIRLIYQREGRSKMPRLSAVKPLGYTSINGRSLGILGALRAYGMLDGRGDEVRVSDDAITILNAPVDSAERREALIRSFEAPAAFALLRAKGDASPDTLRWHLIKANFRDDAADKLIKVYLESRELVNAQVGAYVSVPTREDDSMDAGARAAPEPATVHAARQMRAYVDMGGSMGPSSQPDFKISLGGGRWLLIEVKGGEPTERDFVKLEKFARFQRELLADDEWEGPDDEDRDPSA